MHETENPGQLEKVDMACCFQATRCARYSIESVTYIIKLWVKGPCTAERKVKWVDAAACAGSWSKTDLAVLCHFHYHERNCLRPLHNKKTCFTTVHWSKLSKIRRLLIQNTEQKLLVFYTLKDFQWRCEKSDLTDLTVSMYTRSVDVSDGLLFLTDVESKLYWIR